MAHKLRHTGLSQRHYVHLGTSTDTKYPRAEEGGDQHLSLVPDVMGTHHPETPCSIKQTGYRAFQQIQEEGREQEGKHENDALNQQCGKELELREVQQLPRVSQQQVARMVHTGATSPGSCCHPEGPEWAGNGNGLECQNHKCLVSPCTSSEICWVDSQESRAGASQWLHIHHWRAS